MISQKEKWEDQKIKQIGLQREDTNIDFTDKGKHRKCEKHIGKIKIQRKGIKIEEGKQKQGKERTDEEELMKKTE